MKKYYILIISLLFFIVSFIENWYKDQIFDFSLLLFILLVIFLMVIFNYLIFLSLKKVIMEDSHIDIISILFLTGSVLLFFLFPFREAKVKYELERYEDKRLNIIDKIINEEVKPDEYGNIVLPNGYKKYSTSGEVHLYQNDDNGLEVGFWVFRGMQSGSIELIYSTGGEELIRENENGHPITKIEKLKDEWYLVTTKY